MPSNSSPYRVPSARRTIALQAPAMRTASLQSSSRSTVAGLCGMVTNAPGTLRARNNPLSSVGKSVGATSIGTTTALTPVLANSAL